MLHQKQYGSAEGDGEAMRSLCRMLINGGIRSGYRKWWGELKKEEGEEECRGEERMNK